MANKKERYDEIIIGDTVIIKNNTGLTWVDKYAQLEGIECKVTKRGFDDGRRTYSLKPFDRSVSITKEYLIINTDWFDNELILQRKIKIQVRR